MASEVIFTEFVVTRVLHTTRISNVESTVCDNEERLTAVQSPRTTPVKKESDQAFWNWENCLEQHVLDELAMSWYTLVYFISVTERRTWAEHLPMSVVASL